MTYKETLDFLFRSLPMFSRVGESAFKKDLTNTLRLCEFIGNPQQKLKTIQSQQPRVSFQRSSG